MCAFLSHVAPHGTLPACSLLEDDPLSLRADQDWISEARQLVPHHGDDSVPANIWLFVAADMGCGPAELDTFVCNFPRRAARVLRELKQSTRRPHVLSRRLLAKLYKRHHCHQDTLELIVPSRSAFHPAAAHTARWRAAAVAIASTAMPQPRDQMPMKRSAGDELMPLTETHVNRQSRLQLV